MNNPIRSRTLAVLACVTVLTGMLPMTARTDSGDSLQLLTTLKHPALGEVSGLTAAGYDGKFWVHNDSGDEARLFAIDASGQVLMPAYLASRYQDTPWPGLKLLGAFNVDWEDMTRGADGVLYVADLGNNGNARRDLGVYVLPEPNPLAVDRSRVLSFLPVTYPDQQHYPAEQWHFDSEAIFHADDKLYVLTKHRKPGEILGWEPGSKLYRLDTRFTDRENVLTYIDTMPSLVLPTAADVSADQQHLAVLTYLGVCLFARPEQGDNWLTGASRFIELPREQLKTSEALAWSGPDSLLIGNEERDLLELTLASLP
jgi:hypothetical protein